MRVLVLSWDARAADGGLDPQAAGLAVALAAAGDEVRVVTRLGEGHAPPRLPGVEVHAVTDAPPILPAELDGPVLAAQAFATRAMSVAVRRVEERGVDVVHAVGWQTQPVVTALRAAHGTQGAPVAVVLTGRAVDPAHADAVRASASQLAAAAADAGVLLAPTRTDQQALAGAWGEWAEWGEWGATPVLLPPGADLPARSPGPPPAAGPLHLVAAPGQDHRATARGIREASRDRRRITRSWRRRPFAVAVLDPHDVTSAVRALALGVPLLATAGPVGELASASGGGLVVEPRPGAVAAAVDRLAAEPDLAAVLGATGAAAATHHAWPAVVATWRRAVAPVTAAPTTSATRLHATSATNS